MARFTGKPYDEDLQAHVFPFRNYSSELGRWTSADPAGFPDGPNRHFYAPVPTSGLDPLGLWVDDFGRSGNPNAARSVAVRVNAPPNSVSQQIQDGTPQSQVVTGHVYFADPATGSGVGFYNANGSQISGRGEIRNEDPNSPYTHEVVLSMTEESYAEFSNHVEETMNNPGFYDATDLSFSDPTSHQCVTWVMFVLEQTGYSGPLLEIEPNPVFEPFFFSLIEVFNEV